MHELYTVIGLMSGTSLDGVDAAILRTDGKAVVEPGAKAFRAFSTSERAVLQEAIRAAVAWGFDGPPPNIFAKAEAIIDHAHSDVVQSLMDEVGLAPHDVDLIGYHGQTVLHRAPQSGFKGQTLQIGNGRRLASELGISTVYDFRSADVAAGGHGAPLAPIYHKALLDAARIENAAVINIGGVSNFTLDTLRGLLASDCGPGNGPLDSWVSAKGLGDYDAGGSLSLSGTPDIARLERWMSRDFFAQNVPKSADRYDFDVSGDMNGLSAADGAATLSMFCAQGIANTLSQCAQAIETLVICGGGRHNAAIIAGLAELTQARIVNADDIGWDGDALEAQAFAYMAARHIKGLPLSYPGTTGVSRSMTGGVLAEP